MSSTKLASSPYNRNPSPAPFIYKTSNHDTPRRDSHASYPNAVRRPPPPNSSATTIRLPPPSLLTLARKRPDDDTEIDIFSAEKYFSSTADVVPAEKTARPPPAPVSSALPKSRSQTWTVAGYSHGGSSDTTANSRHGLLRERRRESDSSAGAGCGRSLLGLWCSSCYRKRAGVAGIGKDPAANFVEQKPIFHQSPARWRIEAALPGPWPFPSSVSVGYPTPPPECDRRSESSSELFEIESVATASIAWSVATASAANVSEASERSGDNGKVRRKSSGHLLSGCVSHKAVEVSPMATVETESSISPAVARCHAGLEAGGGSGRTLVGRAVGTSWNGGSGRMVL